VINILCTGYFGLQAMGGGRLDHIKVPALDDSNALAMHFAAILVMASFLLLGPVKKKIFFLVPFIGLTLNAVILAQSRGAMISMIIVGIVAIFVMTKTGKRKFYLYGSLAILSMTLLVGEAMLSKFSTIVSNEDSEVSQDKSSESRMVIIRAQWEMFKDSPVLGYGHQGTLLLSPMYVSEEYMTSGRTSGGDVVRVRASHNLLFALMVDHGLIGTLIYLSIMTVAMLKLLKINRKIAESESQELLKVLIMGLCLSLMLVWIAGMGINNKVLEIDIWLYALIPVVYEMYRKKSSKFPMDENSMG
jgi:O-antigen ligase